MNLTEWQKELLQETFNMALGAAAAVISRLVKQEVFLNIPTAEITTLSKIIEETDQENPISVVYEKFKGEFSGHSFMIYDEKASLDLVAAILGVDFQGSQMTLMEADTLMEIGNIILQNCLHELGNCLERPLAADLPHISLGNATTILSRSNTIPLDRNVIVFKMGFRIEKSSTKSIIKIVLETEDIQKVLTSLDQYQERLVS